MGKLACPNCQWRANASAAVIDSTGPALGRWLRCRTVQRASRVNRPQEWAVFSGTCRWKASWKTNAEYRITQSDVVGAASRRASAHTNSALSGGRRVPCEGVFRDWPLTKWPLIGWRCVPTPSRRPSVAKSENRIMPSGPIARAP